MPISSPCPDPESGRGGRSRAAYALVVLLAGCTTPQASPVPAPTASCAASAPARRQITLYFGRGRRNAEVSDSEWREFVVQALTPHFPKGFTVWDAAGQWQDSTGIMVQERSKIVRLITDDPAAARQAVASIVAEYRRRFEQEAVLQTESDVCVGWT
ncbi:MAG TPA: DUF3574 domain-containing protein [Gemmatimonadales bacterium]|nr:DUF3574 domain-containing protein [Gemmatimonadales bacterium]